MQDIQRTFLHVLDCKPMAGTHLDLVGYSGLLFDVLDGFEFDLSEAYIQKA